jgi:proline dehydrogenase
LKTQWVSQQFHRSQIACKNFISIVCVLTIASPQFSMKICRTTLQMLHGQEGKLN